MKRLPNDDEIITPFPTGRKMTRGEYRKQLIDDGIGDPIEWEEDYEEYRKMQQSENFAKNFIGGLVTIFALIGFFFVLSLFS